LYPILDAFRDTRGPRWQVRFTNTGKAATTGVRISYTYNRLPWYVTDTEFIKSLAAGATSGWVGLPMQDTAHFSMATFSAGGGLKVEVRPVGGKTAARTLEGDKEVRVYLPPYPGKGENPITPEEAIDAILAHLKKYPAPGKKPTKPLC